MKFKHNGNASSVTYKGKEYEVSDDGVVDLPAEAAEHVASHGFKPVAEAKAAKEKPEGKGAK